MTPPRILIVEDQRVVARDIAEHLTRLGYGVAGITSSGEEALRLAEQLRPDLVLMDIRLEGTMDGVDAALRIRERCQLPVVYLTAYADDETLRRAKVTEPFGYVLKPFQEGDLRTAIEMGLYKHQAERKLRDSERRYAVTLASIGDAVIATDYQLRVNFLNPVAEALTGWPRAVAQGRPLGEVFRILNEQTRQPVEDPAARVLREGGVIGLANHTILLPQGGGEVPIDDCAAPIVDDQGRIVGVVLVFHDVTNRRRVEEAIRASEARFRTLVDHATDAFFLHDARGTILDVNRQACESLGLTREELIGMTPFDFDVDADRAMLGQIVARLDAGEVIAFDTRHRRKDGTVFPVEVRIRPFREGGHRYGVSLARDITERTRAKRALVESHNLLTAVVEGTSDAVFVKDLLGRYLMMNSAGARFLGMSVGGVIGKTDADLFAPDTIQAIRERDLQVMATGKEQTFEQTVTAAGVTRTYLSTQGVYRDAQGNAIGVVGISRDVTEIKRLEEQFRQAQKMEAVGQLAGGVAHDFNNLLTAINGYSELVFNSLSADDPNREWVADIQKAAERAANLTRQLLAFSRQQVLQPQVVNLNSLLGELHKLLQRLIGEDIDLALSPDTALGLARVDPGQFEQAVINLAVNARDAMPQGGRLTIQTSNAELGEGDATGHSEVRPGRYVLLAVSDTGHGMDEATRAHIFEPFFTTKEPGKGTGLGLAMVYGFVKQSGGHVEVDCEVGRGTTFRVYLPRVGAAPPSAKPSPEHIKVAKGAETVLLVEDEDSVRTLSRLVLQSNGYTVLEARDGQEGFEVAQQHPGPIHLLITDLVMPRMSGRQLADLLVQARPHLRILYMSGYTDEAVLHQGVPEVDLAFLQKPFSPMGLARKAREVLDANKADQ